MPIDAGELRGVGVARAVKRRRVDTARVVLAAMLLLALGLRVHRLDGQSLWYDEAVTAQVASQGIGELTRWTAADIQPPLYYYVVAGWTRLAGQSEWALRFPSAFFGVLTVALVWAAARRSFGKAGAGRWAAGIAALLSTMLPLHVYFAQEARMYALLTFLGLLAGYALLRTGAAARACRDSGATGQRWWVVFVAASVAMLYTHYFGVFLLVAYGACWLVACKFSTCSTRTRSLVAFGLSTLAIIALYLPWLPAMLNRYRVDASYWQGGLKLGEVLRHVALSFTTGAPEMMLEPLGVRLLPLYGAVFTAAVVALVWRRRHARVVAWLLVVLIVPVVAVLLLASRTPKFNPRYLMLASPPYLLLLAGGLSALSAGAETLRRRGPEAPRRRGLEAPRRRSEAHAPYAAHHAPRTALAFGLTGLLVGASAVSLSSWFTDPAFTKAQWRELAAFVRQDRGPDEAVLLVSGHAYPAWDYYAADIPATRLPPVDILDVNAVLGFDAAPALTQALAGKGGAWLVTWQDEVVDPVGFVPYFLARSGVEQRVESQFWHIGLRHWRLDPGATFAAEPQPRHSESANFDHKLVLLGWDPPSAGQLTVYWRTLHTLQADYQVSLVLEDRVGREVGRWDGRPAGYDYPTTRWRPGEAVFGRYPLPWPPGAPAGVYYVTLAIYAAGTPAGLDIRDVADNPAGKRVRLGPVDLQ